jgi:hypothetical protein
MGFSADVLAEANQLNELFDWPAELELRWVHVTQAERDGVAMFQNIGGKRYVAPATALPLDGQYRVHIQPVTKVQWRLISRLQSFQTDGVLHLQAIPAERIFSRPALQ